MKILGNLFKKQTIISLTLILSIVAITMYSSYASLFKIDPISIAKAHETDNLRITFGNNGYDQQIHLKTLTSYKDEEAKTSKTIEVKKIYLTNNANYDLRFKLYLKNVLLEDSIVLDKYDEKSFLDSKYIKYQINNSEPKSLNDSNLILIDTVNSDLNNIKKIEIKIWVSDEAKLKLNEKEIHLKFEIEEIKQNEYGEDHSLANIIFSQDGGIDNIKKKEKPNFNVSAISNDGLFVIKDDSGDSFYYRGSANNNVVFGKDINGKNLEWKIIRINGDKTIRIILSENSISNYPNLFDNYSNFDLLNNWYKENIENSLIKDYIVSGIFCNYQETNLLCLNDLNKQQIGLLSKEEAYLAGSSITVNNSLYYLNLNEDMWLSNIDENYFYLSKGKIISNLNPNTKKYLRPVINIKGNLIVESGDGSITSPFIFDLN